MSKFKKEYDAVVTELRETKDGVRVVLDIKAVKAESLELERRGKLALFRSIIKEKVVVQASDFAEEVI